MRRAGLAAGAVLAIAGFGGDYEVYLATRILVFALAAIGLDLVVGWCGQISLGHAAFLGIGAYTYALGVQGGLPLLMNLILAISAGATSGAALGLPALRLFGPYLAVASLAFGAVCEQLWIRSTELTGGRMGLEVTGVAMRLPFGDRAQLILFALIVGAVAVVTARILKGPRGRALIALRDEMTATPSLGVDPVRLRVLAFVASAALTSLAGALSVSLTDTLHPDQFSLSTSLELLVMVVLGGACSVTGALLGATALCLLQAFLGSLGELQTAGLGGILLLTVIFAPHGLRGWMRA